MGLARSKHRARTPRSERGDHAAFNRESIDGFTKNGMTVYVAPPEEMARVFAKPNVDAVFENWYSLNDKAGTDGRGLVKKILELKAKM